MPRECVLSHALGKLLERVASSSREIPSALSEGMCTVGRVNTIDRPLISSTLPIQYAYLANPIDVHIIHYVGMLLDGNSEPHRLSSRISAGLEKCPGRVSRTVSVKRRRVTARSKIEAPLRWLARSRDTTPLSVLSPGHYVSHHVAHVSRRRGFGHDRWTSAERRARVL